MPTAPINGLQLYYEIHGEGLPLVLLHGGLGTTAMWGELPATLAAGRQVIAVDLQGHGRTGDIDRPLRYESMGGDITALIRYLGLEKADIMGFSLGGGAALRTAIQHPDVVRKLILISIPFRRTGWYPEILAVMNQMSGAAAAAMKPSPIYQTYRAVAPQPDDFPKLLDKMSDLLRQEYDWSAGVAALTGPVMLVYADADSIPTAHVAAFFELLGGSKSDPGWDGSRMPRARLAVLPGSTHYNVHQSPLLAPAVIPFLDAPMPAI
jgi:pimeloyl-ACP methyl ester carboxylesterase